MKSAFFKDIFKLHLDRGIYKNIFENFAIIKVIQNVIFDKHNLHICFIDNKQYFQRKSYFFYQIKLF